MSISESDFKYVMCPGSQPDPDFRELYNKIYDCWMGVWKDAFKELKEEKPLYSDAFTRQDYVGAIFWKDHCIALCFYRWADANLKTFSDDSYFANWTSHHQNTLRTRGDKIIVCSNFTVHPLARGTQLGVSGKDLLTGMVIETFMASGADGMTGAVRVNRKVNEAGIRWGGAVIDRDIPSGHGDTVDLIGFFKDHINSQPAPELKEFVHNLWNNRLMIPRMHADQDYAFNQIPAKKKTAA